jgi:hypothetical protein
LSQKNIFSTRHAKNKKLKKKHHDGEEACQEMVGKGI